MAQFETVPVLRLPEKDKVKIDIEAFLRSPSEGNKMTVEAGGFVYDYWLSDAEKTAIDDFRTNGVRNQNVKAIGS